MAARRGPTELGGMILLEPGNRVLESTVHHVLSEAGETKGEEKKHAPILDAHLCDFDNVSYHVSMTHDAPGILKVNMTLPCYGEIKDQGAEDALNTLYGAAVVAPEGGHDITLSYDLNNFTGDVDATTDSIKMLKTNVLGGAFDKYFSRVMADGTPEAPFKFDLRPDTVVYFSPKPDRCIVTFSLFFTERVDQEVARVFLQEFQETRRRPGLGSAPPCMFMSSDNPPLEMKDFGITEPTNDSTHLGYLSFPITKTMLKSDAQKLKIVRTLQGFRNYLQYHIKCSKSYFHSRMRARVVSLLKVLNRAKMETEEKKKKTFSGKTFNR